MSKELSTSNQQLANTPSTQSTDEVLVRVENVSKKFCRDLKKSLWYGVCDIASELNPFRSNELQADSCKLKDGPSQPATSNTAEGGPTCNHQDIPLDSNLRRDEFFAVRDVSFELRRGECLGLIGRNGAGKTTLLKMLNGLIKPDSGRIEMKGRIGALIALGAGFNPILTGRENVYVNGTVLGLTKKEIDAKFDEIVDFADIEEFIDTPVRNYSSGMQVRLGFAVATAINPDVLLLDEVLAVGDASFRHKCYNRISKLLDNAAVILVSHSMDYIANTTSRVMFCKQGVGTLFDDVVQGIGAYNDDNIDSSSGLGRVISEVYPPVRMAKLTALKNTLSHGDDLICELEVDCERDLKAPKYGYVIVNEAQQNVAIWSSSRSEQLMPFRVGKSKYRIKLGPLNLHDGHYRINFCVLEEGSIKHCIWMFDVIEFQVRSGKQPLGQIPYVMPASDCHFEEIRK